MSATPMIRLEGVRFGYGEKAFQLAVSHLEVAPAERVACIGPSGTGKSTLVNLIAGILTPERGAVDVGGVRVSELPDDQRRSRRLTRLGMVFQELELLDYLDVLDNILLPFHLARDPRVPVPVRTRARELAEETGIGELLARKPRALSQGERQRVAIARALVGEPELILGDEPTGNLDPDTAAQILDLLFGEVERRGATLLMVTHDHSILDRFDRVIDMGELIGRGEAS